MNSPVDRAHVDFCGEIYPLEVDSVLTLGREGDIVVDDNPYLHRQFLKVSATGSMWWLTNIGSALTATVADEKGLMQAWLAPGAQLPLVFGRTIVWFTAGPTTYEFDIHLPQAAFGPAIGSSAGDDLRGGGEATVGRMSFTPEQKLLLLALAEPVLRRGNRGAGSVPSSAVAAARLGWTLTKFNRKLDNVCSKLADAGIRGLHGGPGKLATNRRARLVEYTLAAQLVSATDLDLLDKMSD